MNTHYASRQRGASLIEALVAFLVLSLGMLAMARVQSGLRQNADVARERSQAVRLAQQDLEALRGFAAMNAASGVPAYAAIANATLDVTPAASPTRYGLTRTVQTSDDPAFKTVGVSVGWTDRAGAPQQAQLSTAIAGHDPVYSGALALPRHGSPVRNVLGRHLSIPVAAKDLGDGTSVVKLSTASTVAYVINNTTGQVSSRCGGVAAGSRSQDLGAAELRACSPMSGLLLGGQVRFSLATPPSATAANDSPLPLTVALSLADRNAAPPQCESEAVKTVAYPYRGGVRHDSVPLAATPAFLNLAAWAETGERHVAYLCVVQPTGSPPSWSGRSSVVAAGWVIGAGANEYKVCRYSADHDLNGRIDSNAEHPLDYARVTAALLQQNFLVIRGGEACPGGAAVEVDGRGAENHANAATVQHQP